MKHVKLFEQFTEKMNEGRWRPDNTDVEGLKSFENSRKLENWLYKNPATFVRKVLAPFIDEVNNQNGGGTTVSIQAVINGLKGYTGMYKPLEYEKGFWPLYYRDWMVWISPEKPPSGANWKEFNVKGQKLYLLDVDDHPENG